MPLSEALIDVALRRACEQDEAYVDALRDATTYRQIVHLVLVQLYAEHELRVRLEQRLRQVMGVEEWHADAVS